MTAVLRRFAFSAYLCLATAGCSGGSYLAGRQPDDIVFRKQSSGGIVERIGGELNAPGFTLTAGGTLIGYDYVGGKRMLVSAKLSRRKFTELYNRISSLWPAVRESRPERVNKDDILPVTELIFLGDTAAYRGAFFPDSSSAEFRAETFGQWIDAYRTGSSKIFKARTIRLYAKFISQGDLSRIPEWPVREIALDSLARIPVGFYEPNVEENGQWISGHLAVKLQRMIPQSGIYQKYHYKNKIFAVGYRPVIP